MPHINPELFRPAAHPDMQPVPWHSAPEYSTRPPRDTDVFPADLPFRNKTRSLPMAPASGERKFPQQTDSGQFLTD